ncbi:MAG: hypothetical protein BWZ08_01415 [candidate division BRC1 bacterium ADurb.BinA292]|nr:MAG: hypothetical protein BWZ08_01415 [candidate division BRC1 bacterium ADurb.BinA292]
MSLLTADDRLLGQIDLKPNRTNAFNNGGIPCTLAHYYIFTGEEKAALRAEWEERRKERLSQPLSSGARMATEPNSTGVAPAPPPLPPASRSDARCPRQSV